MAPGSVRGGKFDFRAGTDEDEAPPFAQGFSRRWLFTFMPAQDESTNKE